ncbi:reverse transcriptase (RNA-dependent DNA polymerase) domain-containing protein [Hirsutella rhossiliensis]|uniref:Reverse transcriptase (RNA-dependent DNA polymerase) domain-containing protein n=1 Tax=Hirsutella rhossiliensis TaxID=111463 RepID=A0A9P8MU05_9HYPO|nr:reverse transcriptase (RNA-dependent DNA polymerase) domain-containing protein [Hirsutella rhossiliensis]KAH0961240.1 reverse transcriptase (RNA-dependent DNA polymerase) domain-containing protein [Hirsutella rhossiliensis]
MAAPSPQDALIREMRGQIAALTARLNERSPQSCLACFAPFPEGKNPEYSDAAKSRIKVSATFSGKKDEFHSFILSIKNKFDEDVRTFRTENSRMVCLYNLLEGKARRALETRFSSDTRPFSGVAEMIQALESAYGNPNELSEALDRLQRLQFTVNGKTDIVDFLAEFDYLTATGRVPEDQMKHTLWQHIPANLDNSLLTKTRDESVTYEVFSQPSPSPPPKDSEPRLRSSRVGFLQDFRGKPAGYIQKQLVATFVIDGRSFANETFDIAECGHDIFIDDLPALAKFSPTIQLSRQAPLSEEKRYRILHKNWRRSDQAPPASVPTPLPTPSPSFQSKSPSAKKSVRFQLTTAPATAFVSVASVQASEDQALINALKTYQGQSIPFPQEKTLSMLLVERDCRSPPEIDFIEPDPSPHAASVLFAPKPNTTARRFCIDYRWMNDHLKSRITPAPSSKALLGCREAQRFTKIDVIQAFHRLRMDPDSEYLTAFRTRFGTFRWKVLPFGLKVGPAWFQQFINAQLHDLLDRCASAYADDVLIYSDKEEDHWKDCQEVIWRLHQANLQGDIKKSRFNVTKVDYLGVLLEAGVGLSVDPRKVRSIQDWKFEDLRDRTAIRSFVGLCNFIRVFCYHASGVAEPLNRLLKKDVAFVMGPEQREAFDQLKRLAIEAPVLAFFRPELPTRLETDASRNATAGVLWQEQPDQTWKPVGFFSRTMTPAERAYPIQDRELLAVVQSLEHFYPELLGQKFDVITDHEALVHFSTKRLLSVRQIRWSDFLAQFDIRFLYRPGRLNVVADALSRKTAELPTVKTPEDQGIQQTPDQDRPELDPNSVPKGAELVSLIRQENLLQDLGTHGTHLIVPAQTSDKQTFLQTALIREAHEPQIFAHAGQNKVIKLLQRDFYWPRMKEDIRRYIRNCHDCRRNKTPRDKTPGLLHPLPVPTSVWEHVECDGRICRKTVTDMTIIVMEAPYTSDPRGVEVTNQYLDQKLRFYVTKHQDNWSSLLPALDFAHNSSWHSSIDMAPLKVALGRDIRNPLSLPPTNKTAATGPAARARELVQTAQETQEDARNAAIAAQERQKEQANRKRRPTDFAIGDRVFLSRKGFATNAPTTRLDNQWSGPFVILEERGHSYVLQLPESYKMKNLFHADRLRKAADNPCPSRSRHLRHPRRSTENPSGRLIKSSSLE